MTNWFRAMATGLALTLASLPAQAETLTDALISAYKNSNLLNQNEAVLRAADEDFAIAISALRPVVSYTLSWGRAWTRSETLGFRTESKTLNVSLGISADLVVLDFGRRDFQIVIARESVLATRQALVQVEQQVLLATVAAYVDVKLAQEIVALRQSNVRLITQELRAAQDRFDVGEITRTDVSIAEARLAAARANLAAAEGDLLIARESFKAATGHYPGNLAPLLRSPAIGKTLEEARAVAVRSHPAIKQAQHEVAAAEGQVMLAEANMKPTIGLGLDITTSERNPYSGESTDSLSAQLGLSMNQTIYAGGRLSALYRKALAGKEASRSGLMQTVVQIEQNLGNAWANLSVFTASIEASDRQIRAAQAAFDGVREEATLGARTTLDVLDAEQELLDARAARLEAEAGRYVAVYQVLASMGLLTVEHLKLGIPTFDPEAYFDAVKTAPATTSRGRKLDEILKKIGN